MLVYVARYYHLVEDPVLTSETIQRVSDMGNLPVTRVNWDTDATVGVAARWNEELLTRCDAAVFPGDWKEDAGLVQEGKVCVNLGIPIYIDPDVPERHRTEQIAPVQARSFLETVMKMYRIHLKKNADYSPANILGTGEIGLITRLWDKTARLLSLSGFHITIQSSKYEYPREPASEAIDDTYLDLAVYAIIGFLLRRNEWGK